MRKGMGWPAGDDFAGSWVNLSAPCSFCPLHPIAISPLSSLPAQAAVLLWPLGELIQLLVFARLFRHNGDASNPVPIPLKCSWEYPVVRTASLESQFSCYAGMDSVTSKWWPYPIHTHIGVHSFKILLSLEVSSALLWKKWTKPKTCVVVPSGIQQGDWQVACHFIGIIFHSG